MLEGWSTGVLGAYSRVLCGLQNKKGWGLELLVFMGLGIICSEGL